MEVAAGVIVAEQVVSTVIEGGIIAGIVAAKPTVPLKVSYSQVGAVTGAPSPYALIDVS